MSDLSRDSSTNAVEDTTARLLRAAGPRSPVSAERAARVRAAVYSEWDKLRRRRVLRRRVGLASALVAIAALTVLGVRVTMRDERAAVGPSPEPIAVVEVVDGTVGGLRGADAVLAGQWIETGKGRVSLRIGRDGSVRIDRDSRLRILSSSLIELTAGAVYLDTGRDDAGFEIRTPLGTARDIGTQFEVRLAPQSLRLRVRTGAVQLSDRTRSISGHAGTEITLTPVGAVRLPLAPDSPEWSWVARIAPPLEMEGMSLAAFLARVAREEGWTLEFRDATLARQAEAIILHGSASTLAPREAAEVAIATSGLRHRLEGGSLVVLEADSLPDEERR